MRPPYQPGARGGAPPVPMRTSPENNQASISLCSSSLHVFSSFPSHMIGGSPGNIYSMVSLFLLEMKTSQYQSETKSSRLAKKTRFEEWSPMAMAAMASMDVPDLRTKTQRRLSIIKHCNPQRCLQRPKIVSPRRQANCHPRHPRRHPLVETPSASSTPTQPQPRLAGQGRGFTDPQKCSDVP
jgi:hypothetical protein